MKLQQMIYFQQICKNGYNISKTADELHVSQPSISNAIKELERKLGVALFNRVDNRLVITKAGEHYLELVEDLINQTNVIEAEMKYFSNAEMPLKIGVSPMEFSSVFHLIFDGFAAKFPEVKLEIYETGDLLTQIKEETIDVAFVSGNGFNLKQFNTHLIKETRLCIFVNASHPLASSAAVTQADLSQLNVVLLNNSRLKTFLIKHQVNMNVLFYTNQISTMLQMVKYDKASTLLLGDIKTSDRIKAVPIQDIDPVRIEMVWKRNRAQSRQLKQFLAFMMERRAKSD